MHNLNGLVRSEANLTLRDACAALRNLLEKKGHVSNGFPFEMKY
jgi:hypothetical protein